MSGQEAFATPLGGIKVIELGTMIAGPVGCTLLGDFGAEIIKIEQPKTGDTLRHLGPFVDGESLFWNVDGRNKKSVAIDLHRPEGQELVKRLVAQADAVVENFRPGTLGKWGLAFEDLIKINPKLVMVSVSGFGQNGPYAPRAAYDRVAIAFGGLLNITGYPDRPPVRPGLPIADYQTALFSAFSLMMALYERDVRSGQGRHVDLALYESIFRFSEAMTAAYDRLGDVRQRQGNITSAAAPGEHFETKDGRFLVLTVANTPMFQRLSIAMEEPSWLSDPRYATPEARWRHINDLNERVGCWVKSKSVPELQETLDQAGVAYSLVYSIEDIVSDPHYTARRNIVTVDSPRIGPIKMQGIVPRFVGAEPRPISPAPELGQHTADVLRNMLGLSDETVGALAQQQIIDLGRNP
ncbi:formyl-CoA transferase [Bradyrhizobium genosp. SA-3]|uniref:CaiB/BaiF CoA transferase family protein n=1 Tax=Bradyrhizobium genosp. SA-3 TaxID=508868 RepID=UPI00102A5724|nr:CoA transferase [Bradyrhizobium genosp. SA-3]RZN03721.1 formyl-CoA transferase [Bradyrhizobium genosp. SA-3]